MNHNSRINSTGVSIICACLISLALLLLPFIKTESFGETLLNFGKAHPLILHFPIAFILLAVVAELTRLYFSFTVGDKYLLIILEIAAISALGSVITGYLLNASGEYSGELILDHFWAGCITTALMWLCIAGFIAYKSNVRYYPFYYMSLLAAVIGTVYTGHLGGSITHGKDYLPALNVFKHDTIQAMTEEQPNTLYQAAIKPIFEMKCINCHNELKTKGGLAMQTYLQLFKPGESNLLPIYPGDPLKSEIYNRIILPADHKDHMPPEGKSPLLKDEISLIKCWIELQAKESLLITDTALEKSEAIQSFSRMLPRIQKYQKKKQLAKLEFGFIQTELDKIGKKIGVDFIKDGQSEDDRFIIRSKFPPAPFSNQDLYRLKPYLELFSKVSLISTAIDDDGLYYLGQMTNLKELFLQKSKVKGSGLIYLKKLKQLETLNLSYTAIDDQGAMFFMTFPSSLKKVFLFRTNTSKEVAKAVSQWKPGLSLLLEEGPYN